MANMNVNGSLEFNSIVGNGLSAILNKIYPIGSIYMSIESASPASFLGGTWEQILGKFLLASDDVLTDGTITTAGSYHIGDSGGEATHTLTVEEMPSHTHSTPVKSGLYTTIEGSGNTWVPIYNNEYVGYSGGGQAHNNMPPYLVVNIWKRIA